MTKNSRSSPTKRPVWKVLRPTSKSPPKKARKKAPIQENETTDDEVTYYSRDFITKIEGRLKLEDITSSHVRLLNNEKEGVVALEGVTDDATVSQRKQCLAATKQLRSDIKKKASQAVIDQAV